METLVITALFMGAIAAVSAVTGSGSARSCPAVSGRAVNLIAEVDIGRLQARRLEE